MIDDFCRNMQQTAANMVQIAPKNTTKRHAALFTTPYLPEFTRSAANLLEMARN